MFHLFLIFNLLVLSESFFCNKQIIYHKSNLICRSSYDDIGSMSNGTSFSRLSQFSSSPIGENLFKERPPPETDQEALDSFFWRKDAREKAERAYLMSFKGALDNSEMIKDEILSLVWRELKGLFTEHERQILREGFRQNPDDFFIGKMSINFKRITPKIINSLPIFEKHHRVLEYMARKDLDKYIIYGGKNSSCNKPLYLIFTFETDECCYVHALFCLHELNDLTFTIDVLPKLVTFMYITQGIKNVSLEELARDPEFKKYTLNINEI